jgi:integrase
MSARTLLGQAEIISGTLWVRLSRSADPTRKRIRIEDPAVLAALKAASSDDERLEIGRQVAHRLSLETIKERLDRSMRKPATSKDKAVEDWFDDWHADRVKRKIVATDKEDRGRINMHVVPVIGGRPMRLVARDEIEEIVRRLDAKIVGKTEGAPGGIAWKTAHNVWTLVRTAFRDAVTSKTIALRVRDEDPTLGVQPPERGEKKTKAFLFPSEFLRLVTASAIWDHDGSAAQLNRAKFARRWMRLFTLATYLQLRSGELRALSWESIDFEHWVIHVHKSAVRHTAGKKEKGAKTEAGHRHFEIEPAVRPLLVAMYEEAKLAAGGKVPTGKVISVPPECDLSARLTVYLKLAGCTREDLFADDEHRCSITFHDLRATGITWRAIRGDNPIKIQRAAGHASLNTTQGYIRTAEDLGGLAGEPFPTVPARVVGAARPKVGPTLAQRSGKVAKLHQKVATPTGIEPAMQSKTPGVSHRFGPIGPTRTPKRPQTIATVRAGGAIERALQAAIAEGRADDAAELAIVLAGKRRPA